jgi:hypothetical protein
MQDIVGPDVIGALGLLRPVVRAVARSAAWPRLFQPKGTHFSQPPRNLETETHQHPHAPVAETRLLPAGLPHLRQPLLTQPRLRGRITQHRARQPHPTASRTARQALGLHVPKRFPPLVRGYHFSRQQLLHDFIRQQGFGQRLLQLGIIDFEAFQPLGLILFQTPVILPPAVQCLLRDPLRRQKSATVSELASASRSRVMTSSGVCFFTSRRSFRSGRNDSHSTWC